ncbi:MAG: hypothetical protein AAGA46_07905 [Cyanobacteria bacterium P01_F01_bin.13]
MPALNCSEIFSSLLTWLKLGASLALLIFLVAKFLDIWENTQTSSEPQNPTTEVIRY